MGVLDAHENADYIVGAVHYREAVPQVFYLLKNKQTNKQTNKPKQKQTKTQTKNKTQKTHIFPQFFLNLLYELCCHFERWPLVSLY